VITAQMRGNANVLEKVTYRPAFLVEDDCKVSLVIFHASSTLDEKGLRLLQSSTTGSVQIDGYYGEDGVTGSKNFIVTKAYAIDDKRLRMAELVESLYEMLDELADLVNEM
jgi:hypothetical protein